MRRVKLLLSDRLWSNVYLSN